MSWRHGNCYGLSNVWHLPVSHIASQNHPRTAYLIWISRSSAINAGYRNHWCTCNWIQIVKYNWVLSILFYTDSKSFKILIGVSFPKMFNVMHENSIIEILLISLSFHSLLLYTNTCTSNTFWIRSELNIQLHTNFMYVLAIAHYDCIITYMCFIITISHIHSTV